MDAYTREFTLETADAAELFRCLQDTAGDDANRRGGGMDALFAEGHAWVLLWQRLDMRRAPSAGDQIKVVTAPGRGGWGCIRAALSCGAAANRSGAVHSVWAIIEIESRSMVPLTEQPLSGEMERQSLRMDNIPAPEHKLYFDFTPAAKHIDRNGHMNNAAYLAALSEYLPKRDGFSLSILYHREIMPEESVRVYWQDVDGAPDIPGLRGR